MIVLDNEIYCNYSTIRTLLRFILKFQISVLSSRKSADNGAGMQGTTKLVINPRILPITTQQPDVSEYTKCDVQLIKLLLMMD